MSSQGAAILEKTSTMRALADWVLSIRSEDLPAAAIQQAKLLVLDTIGCGLAGYAEEIAPSVLDLVKRLGGAPDCSLIGGGRANLLQAVLANGVSVRTLDLNDYLINVGRGAPESAGHPSDNIPVALAVGEARGASGAAVITAIVMGYELFLRLQGLMDRGGDWDGVTASGLVAPAIAGKLMGLDAERLAHALALGLARAATPRAVRSGHLSAAKNLANAQVAETGTQAALLAELGVTGPLDLLEQKYGLGHMFAGGDARAVLTAPMPAEPAIIRASVKAYPCVATGQSGVAAAIELHRRLGGAVDRITGLELTMADYPILHRQASEPERLKPESKESADHSFGFLVAVSLIDGRFGLAQFEHQRWHDPQVTKLMDLIAYSFDPAWQQRAPGAYPATLTAQLSDGSEERIDIPYPPGASRGGLAAEAVIEKFHRVAESVPAAGRERLIEAALALDKASSLRPLMDAAAS